MPSLNTIQLIGHLGSDPEMRFTPNGNATTVFSLANNYRYTKNGETVEITDWFNVVTWGKLAETCNQYLSKGSMIFVEGRIHLNTWDKKDGGVGFRNEVTANKVLFLSSKNRQSQDENTDENTEDLPY